MEIKLLNGDICVPKILGGEGGSNPNNPPYLRHWVWNSENMLITIKTIFP